MVVREGTQPAHTEGSSEHPHHDALPPDFLAAVEFHGHLCPGLAIGYRAATIAVERVDVERGADEELVGIVENDACGVDAFQLITGCTIGKGNLIYRDYGKQAFTLVRRADGRGVRVVMRHDALPIDRHYIEKIMANLGPDASEEEAREVRQHHQQRAYDLLQLAEDRFASVTDVEIELPSKARIFPSVPCSVCGEAVMEARVRMRDGAPCCIPCSDRYGRGWEING